jgi:hypothetical protein
MILLSESALLRCLAEMKINALNKAAKEDQTYRISGLAGQLPSRLYSYEASHVIGSLRRALWH